MSTCQSWQAPYAIDSVQGATPEGVCAAYATYSATAWGDPKPVFPWSLAGDTCTIDQSQFGQSAVATVVHVCDAAEPAAGGSINCGAACSITVVHELALPPLQLTSEEGAQVAFAILGVWAVAFGIRMVVRVMGTADKIPDSSE